MKNRIYYHAYLDDFFSWSHIFTDQLTYMEKQNLLQNVEMMKITAISKNDGRLKLFSKLCSTFPVQIELEWIENKYQNDFQMLEDWNQLQGNTAKPADEINTIKKLYSDCQTEDLNVLYIHTKAVTAVSNTLIKYEMASKFKNRHLWRQFMNWGVIGNWKTCVDALQTHDTAGIDYQTTPPHYKGNFWWTKSSHVRRLNNPQDDNWWDSYKASSSDPWIQNISNRFRNEFWVCSHPETKSFNVRDNNGYYVANDI